MSSNDDKVQEFVAMTSSTPEEAKFYLESAGWDMDGAVSTFFEGEHAADFTAGPSATMAEADQGSEQAVAKPGLAVKADTSKNEKEQRWFTGGGAGSGQEVIAPSQGKKPVDEVFSAAMEMGARAATSEDTNPTSGAFSGGARTLAGGVIKAKESPKQHVIKFYANEIFTVDDGPPRHIHDKANQVFISHIMKGESPPELGADVETDVQLMNIQEDYVEAARPRPVFQGTGNRLGASTSAAVPSAPAPAASMLAWEGPNSSLPITSLQLRLSDGSRMVAKFNHSQPLSDIRHFVASARPDFTTSYSMLTGFPAKPIEDESSSIEAAGLLNATIILR